MTTPNLVINEITPFITSIYQTNLDIDPKIVTNVLALQQDPSNYKLASNQGGWHSRVYTATDLDCESSVKFISPLISQMLPIVQVVYNSLGICKQVSVDGFWFMANHKHDYNKLHNHPGSWLSGVIYLKFPTASGRINFERPDLMYDYLPIDKTTDKSIPEYFWNPVVGDFLLFPSYLKHYVDQNMSTEDDDLRICLAINFK